MTLAVLNKICALYLKVLGYNSRGLSACRTSLSVTGWLLPSMNTILLSQVGESSLRQTASSQEE